jgi:hypothetical protein
VIVSYRELIKLGFSVRAGVRNAQRASALVQVIQILFFWLGSLTRPYLDKEFN